ncbi:MAG: response regulator [Planctomycetota bacterium]|jgi:class 3 adenylate cyclase
MIAKAFVAERGKVQKRFFESFLNKNRIDCIFLEDEDNFLDELKRCEPEILFIQASIIEELPKGTLDEIKRNGDLGSLFIVVHAGRAEGSEFAERVGADRFLPVPFSKAQIDTILRNILFLAKKVLMIGHISDDDPLPSDLFEAGYELIFADDCESGIEVACSEYPDLIIIEDNEDNQLESWCGKFKTNKHIDYIPVFALCREMSVKRIEVLLLQGVNHILNFPYNSPANFDFIKQVAAPQKKGRKNKALVVDDSSMIRRTIARMFKELGFDVLTAEDGAVGLEKAEGFMPDIITSDYDMPNMNGWDFCTNLKNSEITRNIPIIMISARGSSVDKQKGKMLGVASYMTKPFKPEELQNVIVEVLEESRNRQEKEAIAKYVARDAIENVGDVLEGAKEQEPEEKFITIFFSDIASFTPKCEKHSAKKIIELLNFYFDEAIGILVEHNAIIDKLIGDAIVARFNCGDRRRDALNAAAASMKILSYLKEANNCIKESIGIDEEIKIRIGINSGNVIMGNLGSSKARLDYTMIGDNVNVTQRLESSAPVMGCLMSEDTYDLISDSVEAEAPREYAVKGKSSKVKARVLKKVNEF